MPVEGRGWRHLVRQLLQAVLSACGHSALCTVRYTKSVSNILCSVSHWRAGGPSLFGRWRTSAGYRIQLDARHYGRGLIGRFVRWIGHWQLRFDTCATRV